MSVGDRRRRDDGLSTIDHFAELFVLLDEDFRVARLNRAAREYLAQLGTDPGRVMGQVIWDAVPAWAGTSFVRAARRALQERQPVEVEEFLPSLDRWLSVRFLPGAGGLSCFLRDVTAKRVAELAARSSADLVQAVINGIGDGIYAKDLTGRYVLANRSASTLIGRDITGLTDRQLLPEAAAAQIEANDRLVLERDLPLSFEEAVTTPDGQTFLFESNKSVLRDDAGRPTGILGISRNITDSRRERERQELVYEAGARLASSHDLDATFDTIAELVTPAFADYCLVDILLPTGMVQRIRVAVAETIGEPKLADQLRGFLPAPEWGNHPIAVALRTAEPVALYEVTDSDRERFVQTERHRSVLRSAAWSSLISVPFVAQRQVLGVLTVAYGASGRRYGPDDLQLLRSLADRMALSIVNARLFRTMQDELARRTKAQAELTQWDKIFEHAGWGVAIGDPETGRYVRVNETYARMHGYSVEELTASPIWSLTTPSNRDFAQQQTRRALSVGRVAYSSRHQRRDGTEFPVRVDLSAISDGRGVLLAANVQDDSERQGAEERLREAQKMEALGRLAGGVAHDFNNMLMIIMGFADFLVAAMDESDVRRKDATEIRKASERAAALTQQLMMFGRRIPMRPTAVDLNEVILALGDMLRSVLGESIQLRVELNPAPGGIRMDRGHLEQALLNLALNAKDAMPTGGRLTMSTRSLTVNDGPVPESGVEIAPGEYELVEVADSGHGMDEETRARIFEPFFTTRAGSRNSGLGLSVVYGMVTQNSGHVWVTSRPGVGSRFTLCFPRIAVPAIVSPAGADVAPAGHESVLVVEDERAVRQLVDRALSQAGYRVTVASDADQAIELLKGSESFRALVSDLVLPGMSGTELAAIATESRPGLAVVLMSGHAASHAGPVTDAAFLTKPFATTELVRRVREAIDGREDGKPGRREA